MEHASFKNGDAVLNWYLGYISRFMETFPNPRKRWRRKKWDMTVYDILKSKIVGKSCPYQIKTELCGRDKFIEIQPVLSKEEYYALFGKKTTVGDVTTVGLVAYTKDKPLTKKNMPSDGDLWEMMENYRTGLKPMINMFLPDVIVDIILGFLFDYWLQKYPF